MSNFGQTLKGYIWWTSPRGSVRYDVMVTLILAFIFLTPLWVNFRDKPVERSPHQTEVVVQQEGDGFLYKVDAARGGQGPQQSQQKPPPLQYVEDRVCLADGQRRHEHEPTRRAGGRIEAGRHWEPWRLPAC